MKDHGGLGRERGGKGPVAMAGCGPCPSGCRRSGGQAPAQAQGAARTQPATPRVAREPPGQAGLADMRAWGDLEGPV